MAYRTLSYAFALAGEEAGPVHCALTGPDGKLWRFGDVDAPSVINGPAGELCRAGARRLVAEESALVPPV
jgi:hypothetical protein